MLVCRCEEVTKGEIRQAVHAGMLTIEEIRRFLRCGMGLCQGQTCGKLVKGIFTNPKGSRFACYDMLMTICPAMLLTIITIVFNAIIAVLGITGVMSTGVMITSSLSSIFFCLFNFTLFMFMFGALTTFTEWDNIHAPARKKIFYMFTFPLFMITYIPIALVALVKKASWKPIQHSISVDVQEFAQANAKDRI